MAQAIVTPAGPKDAQARFLSQVANKFRLLLEREPDRAEQIRDASLRMEAADLIHDPQPTDSPEIAARMLFEQNPLLTDVWMEVREMEHWRHASTPAEIVSAFLPNPDSLV
jgi:hypothetical protein